MTTTAPKVAVSFSLPPQSLEALDTANDNPYRTRSVFIGELLEQQIKTASDVDLSPTYPHNGQRGKIIRATLPAELVEQVDAIATERGSKRSFVVRRLLEIAVGIV